MIGITFALPTESSDLRRQLVELGREANLLFGKLDNQAVTIVHTGVGAKNCSERMETLLHKSRPRLVISSGFAGAVVDDLQVGELLLAKNFSDPELVIRSEGILRDRKPRVAKLFTSTSIIDSVAERNEIARSSGAAGVDMETGAIVAVCNAHRVPLLSLRAISDTPSRPFPLPPSVLFDIELQRTNYRKFSSYLIEEPPALLRLFRFSLNIKRIRRILTRALVALVKEI